MSEEQKPPEHALEKIPRLGEREPKAGDIILAMIQTAKGEQLVEEAAEGLKGIGAGFKTMQESKLEAIRAQVAVTRLETWLRYGMMAFIILGAGFLEFRGHLDATIAGLLGTALGYLFGRETKKG